MSLAVGMAQIFTSLPGMKGLMAYWYHFAIMFEALFILTTIDAGTRVGRFLLQEFVGRVWTPFGDTNWLPGAMASTLALVLAWAYFIWTGSISTIWPMFGIANQLLASVALAVGTTIIINIGRAQVRLGHAPAALLRVDDDADGRLHERARQLLADGHRRGPGAAGAGLRQLDLHGHHDDLRGHHPRVGRAPLGDGAHRENSGPRTARSVTTHP